MPVVNQKLRAYRVIYLTKGVFPQSTVQAQSLFPLPTSPYGYTTAATQSPVATAPEPTLERGEEKEESNKLEDRQSSNESNGTSSTISSANSSEASSESSTKANTNGAGEQRRVEINFAAILTSPIVTFLLGASSVVYRLHLFTIQGYPQLMDLIPAAEDGRKMFDVGVELKNDDPEAFACLVEFLYKGSYAPTFYEQNHEDEENSYAAPESTRNTGRDGSDIQSQGHWIYRSNHLNKYSYLDTTPTANSPLEASSSSHRSHALELLQAKVWVLARIYGIEELEKQSVGQARLFRLSPPAWPPPLPTLLL